MRAANMGEIKISGAVFIKLTGTDSSSKEHMASIMAYVSPSTEKFYLSREALIQPKIIPKNFPKVGAALELSAVEAQTAACGCLNRSLPPERPKDLPFPACPENCDRMKKWLSGTNVHTRFSKQLRAHH